jgi:hypothetical protein
VLATLVIEGGVTPHGEPMTARSKLTPSVAGLMPAVGKFV